MNLSAPTMPVFVISAGLFLIALVAHFVAIPVATPHQYWVAILGYAVLAAGNLLKDF